MKDFLKREEGAISVLLVLAVTFMFGSAAFAVDLGSAYDTKIKLQNAVDSAVYAAGELLPAEKTSSAKQEVIEKAEESLTLNGFSPENLSLQYEWSSNDNCLYALRITASKNVQYGFARAIGFDSSNVSATAKATAVPVTSTFKAISVYILKSDFEAQLKTIDAGSPFEIKISTSGAASSSSANMGIIRIVTDSDKNNYASIEGITSARDKEFFETGYYGLSSSGVKYGLAVGDTRTVENNSSIYSNSYTGMYNRICNCQTSCGSGCSHTNHSASCPRIALLPVVSVSGSASGSTSSRGNRGDSSGSSNGTATVQYFVAIYIESVTKTSSYTTITAYYLDDYREVSDVDETDEELINQFMVCGTTIEE